MFKNSRHSNIYCTLKKVKKVDFFLDKGELMAIYLRWLEVVRSGRQPFAVETKQTKNRLHYNIFSLKVEELF